MPEGIKNAVLIYNPTSGRKRHRRFADVEQAGRILKQAGIATELAPTTGPQAATKMARQAVEQSRDLVIGCGGDGTINEIVNGLAGSNVPLALLPAGTANILAKELCVPWDIPHAARLIPSGVVRRIALGLAVPALDHLYTSLPRAGRYFLCVAGAGPDGAIVNNVDEILKKNAGVVAYWVEGLKQLFTYGFPDLQVSVGKKSSIAATIIVIGRTANCMGGLFPEITTGSEPVRGLLRSAHEFDAQQARVPHLPARALDGKSPQQKGSRSLEDHGSDLRSCW